MPTSAIYRNNIQCKLGYSLLNIKQRHLLSSYSIETVFYFDMFKIDGAS